MEKDKERISHDQNFKNIVLDFPVESLEFAYPDAQKSWGKVQNVDFVRQEPRKRRLKDGHLAMDMPVMFTFETHKLLLWLIEFKEDKSDFSICQLARYTVDLIEEHPGVDILPAAIFTDRRKWRKPPEKKLHLEINNRLFLHFEYLLLHTFDFNALEYLKHPNPVVRILLPKMSYPPEARHEVVMAAYSGLYQLPSSFRTAGYGNQPSRR